MLKEYSNILKFFPSTRYMGSKTKIVPQLWEILKEFEFNSFLDGFAGSNVVSYYMKAKGKKVISNDFMKFSYHYSNSLISNSKKKLNPNEIEFLLTKNPHNKKFIQKTFADLYFTEDDNVFLDNLILNIDELENVHKKSLALASISRACIKRRPRGIFTYVGNRYDDGRKDLQYSLKEHFINNVQIFNNAVFDNGQKNLAFNRNIYDLKAHADVVYLDPPYLSTKSDNDYIRRYHFVEGLVQNWDGLEIQEHTKTKKFKRYKSMFDSKATIVQAFDSLFNKFADSIIVVSYSSNCIPERDTMIKMINKYKARVHVEEINHRYSFGNQNHKIGNNSNMVKEYLFIGY